MDSLTTSSLIGQVLMMIFHVEGSTGFYYENPANDLSDGDNFVRERVSDDDDILIGDGENGDGENDNDRGHSADDHGNHDGFYHFHVGEGTVGDGDQNDDNLGSRGSICHLCICSGSVENHGHDYDDHDLKKSDDDEKNNRDEGVERVEIYHGNYRGRA